jgi:hypothetical protein
MGNINETPRYEVQKVKVKNGQLTVDYTESYSDANYKNEVVKTSEQYVHADLKYALRLLKPHAVAICEMPEAGKINVADPSEEDLVDTLDKIIITGYSKSGSDDNAGVCIIAQRILKTGQILNVTTPFTKFYGEAGDGYPYGEELQSVVKRCDYEVDAYLFEGKFGAKQLSLDFDFGGDEAAEEKPKKRGRKKKASAEEPDASGESGTEREIMEVEFEELPMP